MATKEQKAKIEKLIVRGMKLLDALKEINQKLAGPLSDEEREGWSVWPPILKADINDVMNKAIVLADKYYGIELPEGALGEPTFDIDLVDLGQADPVVDPKDREKGKGKVRIGPKAFQFEGKPSPDWLASTKYHELQGHCAVGYNTRKFTEEEMKGLSDSITDEERDKLRVAEPKIPNPEGEVIAYARELAWAEENGLSKKMLEDIKRRLKGYFDELSAEKKKEWKEKLPWLASFLPEGANGFPKGYAMVAAASPLITSKLHTFVLPRAMMLEVAAQMAGFGDVERFLALNSHLTDEKNEGLFKSPFRQIGVPTPITDLEELLMQEFKATDVSELEKAAKRADESGAARASKATKKKKEAATARNPNPTDKSGELENDSADQENAAFDSYTKAAERWDKLAKAKQKAGDAPGARVAGASAKASRDKAKAAKKRAAEAHERAAADFDALGDDEKKAEALDKAGDEREDLSEL